MQVAALILAAGASTRLGHPKQLIQLNGETLLERAIRMATDAGCKPVVVVLGSSAAAIAAACDLSRATLVINHNWQQGMGSSVQAGMAAVQTDAVILMTCDQPAVTSDHLQALMRSGQTTASGYDSRRGVPAFFPAIRFEELLQISGDQGARQLLASALIVDLKGGGLDIDTPEALKQAREQYEQKG